MWTYEYLWLCWNKRLHLRHYVVMLQNSSAESLCSLKYTPIRTFTSAIATYFSNYNWSQIVELQNLWKFKNYYFTVLQTTWIFFTNLCDTKTKALAMKTHGEDIPSPLKFVIFFLLDIHVIKLPLQNHHHHPSLAIESFQESNQNLN